LPAREKPDQSLSGDQSGLQRGARRQLDVMAALARAGIAYRCVEVKRASPFRRAHWRPFAAAKLAQGLRKNGGRQDHQVY